MLVEDLQVIMDTPVVALIPLCGMVPQSTKLNPATERQTWDLRDRIALVAPRLITVDLSGPKSTPAPAMVHRPKP